MTYQVKVKSVKTGIVGEVFNNRRPGETGIEIEDYFKGEGWNLQNGEGADCLDYGIEIKSRNINSRSAYTIGRMSPEKIIDTPYKDSPIRDKLRSQLKVTHNDGYVTSAEIFDLTHPYIQERLREAYEDGREQLANGKTKNYIKCKGWGFFEKASTESSYQFRLTPKEMRNLEAAVKNVSAFDSHFSQE